MNDPEFLPELFVPSRANQCCTQSGMDSIELCKDSDYFLAYPHTVEYNYNSRGFRDSEWPENLLNVIWCIGDSYTLGLGSPITHTWPSILQQRTGCRTINVSMDGASNNWIARIASSVLEQLPTATIVVHWSFLHRRELDIDSARQSKFQRFYNTVRDPDWPDCDSVHELAKLPIAIQTEIMQIHKWTGIVHSDDRVIHYVRSNDQQDIHNTDKCIQQLSDRVIHSAIPNWAPPGVKLNFDHVILTQQLDRARDGHHYDILTSNALVDQLIPVLTQRAID